LLSVLEESLRLLHPFLPFVTEEIYGKLPNARGALIIQAYPETEPARNNPELEQAFSSLKEMITMVRALRAEFGIPQERKLKVAVRFDQGFASARFIEQSADLVALMAGAGTLDFVDTRPASAIALAGRGFETYVFAREAVDVVQLAARFRKEADKEAQFASRLEAKLGNPAFAGSAPAEVVAKEREKLDEAKARIAKLEKHLADLA
jgi:valyl-tRNA synthetase